MLCAAFVLAMTVVGGLTRLTRSGLSIVEWKPITGVVPPVDEGEWAVEYAKYKASPEGTLINHAMTVDEFKDIYLVEWGHRLLGRITGFVVLVPFLFFLATRRLRGARALRVLGIFALGALQAAIGWFMVKSGLVDPDTPHVSHYRLAMHLVMALAILGLLVWSALDELPSRIRSRGVDNPLRPFAWGTIVLAFLTVTWGAFMAGLHAGHVAPTFPDMNGALVPTFSSITSDAVGVHFAHRILAWCTGLGVVVTFALTRIAACPPRARALATLLLLGVVAQIVLGALTVLHHVPIALAALHQANGACLVACAVALAHSLQRDR